MSINLGQRVREKFTGLTGVVVARTEWLFGCVRLTIQPEGLHEGKPRDPYTADEPQFEPTGAPTVPGRTLAAAPAGGTESPTRQAMPPRV